MQLKIIEGFLVDNMLGFIVPAFKIEKLGVGYTLEDPRLHGYKKLEKFEDDCVRQWPNFERFDAINTVLKWVEWGQDGVGSPSSTGLAYSVIPVHLSPCKVVYIYKEIEVPKAINLSCTSLFMVSSDEEVFDTLQQDETGCTDVCGSPERALDNPFVVSAKKPKSDSFCDTAATSTPVRRSTEVAGRSSVEVIELISTQKDDAGNVECEQVESVFELEPSDDEYPIEMFREKKFEDSVFTKRPPALEFTQYPTNEQLNDVLINSNLKKEELCYVLRHRKGAVFDRRLATWPEVTKCEIFDEDVIARFTEPQEKKLGYYYQRFFTMTSFSDSSSFSCGLFQVTMMTQIPDSYKAFFTFVYFDPWFITTFQELIRLVPKELCWMCLGKCSNKNHCYSHLGMLAMMAFYVANYANKLAVEQIHVAYEHPESVIKLATQPNICNRYFKKAEQIFSLFVFTSQACNSPLMERTMAKFYRESTSGATKMFCKTHGITPLQKAYGELDIPFHVNPVGNFSFCYSCYCCQHPVQVEGGYRRRPKCKWPSLGQNMTFYYWCRISTIAVSKELYFKKPLYSLFVNSSVTKLRNEREPLVFKQFAACEK